MRKFKVIVVVVLLLANFVAVGQISTGEVTIRDRKQGDTERYAETNVAKLNVRQSASKSARSVRVLENKETPLVIVEETVARDNTLWYHVAQGGPPFGDMANRVTLGWVLSDYVTDLGEERFLEKFSSWSSRRQTGKPTQKPTARTDAKPTNTPVPLAPPIYYFPSPLPVVPPIYHFPTPVTVTP